MLDNLTPAWILFMSKQVPQKSCRKPLAAIAWTEEGFLEARCDL